MKTIKLGILGAGLFVSLNLLHAQALSSAQNIQSVGSAVPDSPVQVVAEAQGLAQVAPADRPPIGTYWCISPYGTAAPLPVPPTDLSLPVYQVAAGIFIVDQTGGQVSQRRAGAHGATLSAADAVAAQSDAVLNLITQLQSTTANRQTRTLSRAMGLAAPMAEDGSSDSPSDSSTTAPAMTGLYLEITNKTDGWTYLRLHNATNEVYAIESTVNLQTGFQVETELWPVGDQTNVLPFAVQNLGRQPLFLRAQDWTGVTENGNTTPDWWLWLYYGTTALSDTNLDSQGNTLLYDYTNGLDPNVIQFTLEAANDYVNTPFVNLQASITAGTPSYYAVRVNGQTGTNWLPFVSANLTASLGATDGVYTVSVGLKGLPANATQTWNDYSFTLDRTAPVLTITNPVIGGGTTTAITPYLQLKGFANESLTSLSYDISNATGMTANQSAFVTDQDFATDALGCTTNYFQCYDVPLVTNSNFITLRVTDRAGNTTTTNFNVVLDYSTATSPVIALTWPTNGMELCGGSFTLRGWADDPSATVYASITDTNNHTTTVAGEVERSGVLWAEDLPLNNGTNWITLNVTNAAGLSSTTNLMVIKSDVTLTVTNISGDLWVPPVNVSGLISEPDYAVYVNGMRGTNYGDGTWEVDDVPVSPSGVASFDVNAIPPGGGDPAISTNVVKDPEIVVVKYGETRTDYSHGVPEETNNTVWTRFYLAGLTNGADGRYYETNSGYSDINESGFHEGWPYAYDDQFVWSDTIPGGWEVYTVGGTVEYAGAVPWGSWLDAYYAAAMATPDAPHYYGDKTAPFQWQDAYEAAKLTVDAQTQVKLYTGGRALSGRKNLFCISAWADEYRQATNNFDLDWEALNARSVDKTKLVVGQMGSPGGDGKLWVALPDNAEPYVTVVAPGIKHYNAGPVDNTGMQKYPLVITASTNGTAVDLSTTKPEFCVGQQVTFTLAGLPMGSISNMVGKWQLPTNYVNNVYQQFVLFSPAPTVYDVNPGLLANTNQVSCWYVKGNGGHIMVGLSLLFNNGQYANVAANGDFAIYRPTFSGFQNDGNGLDWDSPYLVGTMDWDVNLDSKYDGLFGVTQTLNSNNENSDYYTGGFDTLDGDTEIYGTPNTNGPSIYIASDPIIKHNIFFGDAPKAIAAPCANMIVNFNDYLRFKPGVLPNDGNIYVTIATNGWYVNGSACLIGSISPNDLPPATAPVNNVAFPTWTAVRHGGGH